MENSSVILLVVAIAGGLFLLNKSRQPLVA